MLKVLVLSALCVCALGGGEFTPHVDVAFHATVDKNGKIEDSYIVQFGGQVYYNRVRYDDGVTTLVRCDIQTRTGECFGKNVEDSSSEPLCSGHRPKTLEFFNSRPYSRSTATACPDGVSDGCMKYTQLNGANVTADSRNRVVMFVDWDDDYQISITRITYHDDDVPTVDTFADTDCEGNALKDPTPFGTVSLKDLGCAFSLNLHGADMVQDIRGFKKGDDIEFLMVNSSVLQEIVRCDVSNSAGDCYGELYDYKSGCDHLDGPRLLLVFNIALPQGEYNYLGEPENVSCPEDGSAECMKYSYPDQVDYIIVDSQDRVVAHGHPGNVMLVKYYDEEPSIDLFNDLKCNLTVTPAKDPCHPLPPSSSSTKPVDPSSSAKPVAPSSVPVSSSSMTNIAVLLVIAVAIVALL